MKTINSEEAHRQWVREQIAAQADPPPAKKAAAKKTAAKKAPAKKTAAKKAPAKKAAR